VRRHSPGGREASAMLVAAPWPPASHDPALCGLIEGGSPMSDITLGVGGGARRITYAGIA